MMNYHSLPLITGSLPLCAFLPGSRTARCGGDTLLQQRCGRTPPLPPLLLFLPPGMTHDFGGCTNIVVRAYIDLDIPVAVASLLNPLSGTTLRA